MKFPVVVGSNLSGKRYTLPQDFEGQYNLALTVYQRYQQGNVDSWGPLLSQLAAKYPEFRYYELPTLPNYGWIQQTFINGGMLGGIPDKTVRARTITLYLDVKRFNAALNLPTIDSIYALLVDRQGEILFRADGDYSPEKGEALSKKLADLLRTEQTTG